MLKLWKNECINGNRRALIAQGVSLVLILLGVSACDSKRTLQPIPTDVQMAGIQYYMQSDTLKYNADGSIKSTRQPSGLSEEQVEFTAQTGTDQLTRFVKIQATTSSGQFSMYLEDHTVEHICNLQQSTKVPSVKWKNSVYKVFYCSKGKSRTAEDVSYEVTVLQNTTGKDATIQLAVYTKDVKKVFNGNIGGVK